MDGSTDSAAAWIADMAEGGDFGRRHVLDTPMLERVRLARAGDLLDVGCGEGRFCRMASELGLNTVGVDPVDALVEHARLRDPAGDYRVARAENLPFGDARFPLVVAYLSLIDIPDLQPAIAEMVRVMRPGGRLLIANLTSFNTASMNMGWVRQGDGRFGWCIDRYMEERGEWCEWRGIRVRNWHRPLSTYMKAFLEAGLILTHFSEPLPTGGDPRTVERYNRAPWFLMMEWLKPA